MAVFEPTDDSPGTGPAPEPPVPAIVLATAILLYVGAATGVLLALVAGALGGGPMSLPSMLIAVYYALHVGLGYALLRRKRWARVTLVVLSLIGLAIAAGVAISGDRTSAINRAAGPVTYLILINTATARAWFRRRPAPAE